MTETGIDIVGIERFRRTAERTGDAFLKKIFHPEEIRYCSGRSKQYEHYAARFAAKEAARKILLDRMKNPPPWTDIYILNRNTGKPDLILDESILRETGVRHISVSLTHTAETAAASVIMEFGDIHE